VPARANSPADVEIDTATRDGSAGNAHLQLPRLLDESFSALNTVFDGINPAPANMTQGEGPRNGKAVQITITFTPPIVLPADHYFFRPEVLVTDSEFLFLSAPKPIVAPGTPFMGDLQAWIRNSDLKPDWLRIGTDIIGGTPVQTFNMTLSLTGETETQAGTPTPTATPQPTATPTLRPNNNDGGGCSIGATPSANGRTLWFLLAPAAVFVVGAPAAREERNARSAEDTGDAANDSGRDDGAGDGCETGTIDGAMRWRLERRLQRHR
jgi:hypothetical protein